MVCWLRTLRSLRRPCELNMIRENLLRSLGVPKVSVVEYGIAVATSDPFVMSFSSTLQQGDMVIAYSARNAFSYPVSPIGYTTIERDIVSASFADAGLTTSYKFMTSTPDSSITFDVISGSSDAEICGYIVLRGVRTSSPIYFSDVYPSDTNPDPQFSSTYIPSGRHALVAIGATGFTSSSNLYTTSNLTDFVQAFDTTSFGDIMLGAGVYQVPGAFLAEAFTPNMDASNGGCSIGITIVLRPQ